MPALQHPHEADDAAKSERADNSLLAPAARQKGGRREKAEAGRGIARNERTIVRAGPVEGEGRGVGEGATKGLGIGRPWPAGMVLGKGVGEKTGTDGEYGDDEQRLIDRNPRDRT